MIIIRLITIISFKAEKLKHYHVARLNCIIYNSIIDVFDVLASIMLPLSD